MPRKRWFSRPERNARDGAAAIIPPRRGSMTNQTNSTTSAAEIVARVHDLTTLPDIYVRVKSVIDDPNSALPELADIISTDPVTSGRLLRIANSAFYGLPSRVSKVTQAVSLLGTQQVHDLVLATSVVHAFGGIPQGLVEPRAFWHSNLLAASAAKRLADDCGILDSERLFVAGLLAQIGLLVLFREMPTQMRDALDAVQERDLPIGTVLRELIGFDYAAVSAELFRRWGLPTELISPMRYHTRPGIAKEYRLETDILHIAVAISNAEIRDKALKDLIPELDSRAWDVTGLTPESFLLLAEEASALTEQIAPAMLESVA